MMAVIMLAIEIAAGVHRVPVWILDGVAWMESRYHAGAVNVNTDGSIDRGIFQLNDRSHPGVDPWPVEAAAMYAAHYLHYLYRRCGSWRGALEAYNCGIGRWLRGDVPARSRAYARAVLCFDPIYR